jgi:uncharacterized protein YabN with tetrapyrrole methylase and pyrophosphatase domain
LGLSPEIALQKTNNKFIKRFQTIEAEAAKMNKHISELSLEQMDVIWNSAKSQKT